MSACKNKQTYGVKRSFAGLVYIISFAVCHSVAEQAQMCSKVSETVAHKAQDSKARHTKTPSRISAFIQSARQWYQKGQEKKITSRGLKLMRILGTAKCWDAMQETQQTNWQSNKGETQTIHRPVPSRYDTKKAGAQTLASVQVFSVHEMPYVATN